MNIENIHDALNLLDDDLIEKVDKLRNEKTHIIKMHRKKAWIRWVSIAACIGLVVITVYATDGFGLLMTYRALNSDSGTEDNLDRIPDDEDMQESSTVGQNETEEDSTDATDYTSEETKDELQSVMVEIVSWGENEFVGTITGEVDENIYGVGTSVTVKFNDDIHIKVSTDNGAIYKEYIPDSTDFPVGSNVCIEFNKQETVEHTPNDTNNNMYREEVIIYAETITLSDSE